MNIVPLEDTAGVAPFQTASKVQLDGISLSDPARILSALRTASIRTPGVNVDKRGTRCSQIIRYGMNAAGEVNYIDTAAGSGSLTAHKDNSDEVRHFNSLATSFETFSIPSKRFYADDKTKIIFVPSDRSKFEEYDSRDYKASLFDKDDLYVLEAYDVKGQPSIAGAVVVYIDTFDTPVKKKSPVAIITKLQSAIRPDGEFSQLLTCYLIGKDDEGLEPVTFYTESADTLTGYHVGDVIRFAVTREGYIKNNVDAPPVDPDEEDDPLPGAADTIQRHIDVSSATIDPFTTDYKNNPLLVPSFIDFQAESGSGYDYRVCHGLLYAALEAGKNLVEIAPIGTRTSAAVESVADQRYAFVASKATRYFTYDASLPGDKVTAHGEALPLSGYPSYTNGSEEAGSDESARNAAEVYTYECEGKVLVVYIIKR
jgi:hypothetical protein